MSAVLLKTQQRSFSVLFAKLATGLLRGWQ